MRFPQLYRFTMFVILSVSVGLAAPGHAGASQLHHTHHAASSKRVVHSTSRHRISSHHSRYSTVAAHRSTVSLGQRGMAADRATEIQQALIQAHYLNGSPTGQWDAETQAAMHKYQIDNGWQSKITPDSRAIIKLGLGPKQDEGEYPAEPSGVSRLTDRMTEPSASAPIRTLAASEMAAVTQN